MNAEIRTFVAERLRSERARLDLSQADLASAGGVSLRTQASWEKGDHSPNADYLVAIAALGVDVHFILTGRYAWETANGNAGQSGLSSDEQAVVKAYNALQEKAKVTIRDLLSLLSSRT